ncbi:hypothetical protein N9O59_05390, partial [Schleiferiaceae bacterium]|nr:hypothetical protein [Schleiferiaceae bacterium]
WCEENNFTMFSYYYMQSKSVYFFKSLFDSAFSDFNFKELSFKPLSVDEIVSYFKEASIVLDINHPEQRGLTMRTFEALGAGRKIITTNSEIKTYSFYDANNIFVIDRDCVVLDKAFFALDFNPIDEDTLFEMSITGWIKSLFIQNDPYYWLNT